MNNIERSPERRIENMPRGILERVGGFMKGTLKWALILTGIAAAVAGGAALARQAGWTQSLAKQAGTLGQFGQGLDSFAAGSQNVYGGIWNGVTGTAQRGWENLRSFWPSSGPGRDPGIDPRLTRGPPRGVSPPQR